MEIEIEKKYNFTMTQIEYNNISDLLLLARNIIEYASFENSDLSSCREKAFDIVENFNLYTPYCKEKSFFFEDEILALASKNIATRISIHGGI